MKLERKIEMEPYGLPDFPKYHFADLRKCQDKSLNPVVVLTDIMKSKEGRLKTSLAPSTSKKSPSPNMLTPPRSTPSPSLAAIKRKRKIKDPNIEYEIEEIVGYHRDKKNRMWYLIKWKGWSEKYNTFELIENLTSCNYKLMQYFEMKKPSKADIKKKKKEISRSLKSHNIFNKLVENNFRSEDLKTFSEECLNISQVFDESKIDKFEKKIRQEFYYIVRCLIGMYSHQDPGLFLRAQNYNICLKLIQLRRNQLQKLSEFEKNINKKEKILIKVENNFDLDFFPDFTYIVNMKYGENVIVPNDPVLGCDCKNECSTKSNCCGKLANSVFAYNSVGRLRFPDQIPIYECNSRCLCPKSCSNRVVQHGRKIPLCIFKTPSCGWGVKTLEKIPRGTFVCEYIGELIPDSEAVVRDLIYVKKNDSYLFNLDFNIDATYCIDATYFGNVTRFINHSCDPNLAVYPVWVDCLEPNLHRLAFFARRNIRKFEEIHFDYENLQDGLTPECDNDDNSNRVRMISKVRCQCKATNCREWVFGYK